MGLLTIVADGLDKERGGGRDLRVVGLLPKLTTTDNFPPQPGEYRGGVIGSMHAYGTSSSFSYSAANPEPHGPS